eukprot:11541766-Alexandrium_andersonii.AAC.1
MKAWVKQQKLTCTQTKYKPSVLGLEHARSFPELKTKAHNCRVQLAWVAALAQGHQHNEHDRHRACVAWAIADWCWVCDSVADWQLPDDAAERLYERGH